MMLDCICFLRVAGRRNGLRASLKHWCALLRVLVIRRSSRAGFLGLRRTVSQGGAGHVQAEVRSKFLQIRQTN